MNNAPLSGTSFACGFGVGTRNAKDEWLEVFFPAPCFQPDAEASRAFQEIIGSSAGGNETIVLGRAQRLRLASQTGPFAAVAALARSSRPLVAVRLERDLPLATVPEAYLKLHLLSHRLARPGTIDLTNVFKVLPNVAWTNHGAIDLDELGAVRLRCRIAGEPFEVTMVDKFPPMVNYVVPSGVRIADGARVRLGAYLGPGTTVMHEGFVNFNAGTEGPNMVEGRVSSSVWVGAGTDLGGGSSIMGVLSGGNTRPIAMGQRCLLGANAGLGIPLGDDCTVEAGLYVTAGSKVRVIGADGAVTRTVKAAELAGQSALLFRRHSQEGAIECLRNPKAIVLNEALHSHN